MTIPRWLLIVLLCSAASARGDHAPTPEESLAALRLADPTLKIELVAADPLVTGPVAIAWDEYGRLFVVEMTDYPVGPPSGRIKRLEDRDGDGRLDHATIFAEQLPYPTGLLPWSGGLLVTAAPDLLFLRDDDGDGRADTRRVVLTGFHEGNQQLRVNSPTYGIDNWVYLANGRSGGAIRRPDAPPDRAIPIPRNDLRLNPASGEFEPVSGFSQFGLPRDDWGHRFPSWNTVPIRHVVLERSDVAEASSGAPTVAEILDLNDGGRIFSLAPPQRRFNAETVAFFNATCGPTIYRGDRLGAYRGDAFICEPLSSVVHHRRLESNGPTFVARRVEPGREFLASTHPWFRPVNLATGPDGALYVVDFCRAWVEHPAFVPEAQRGAVNFREGDTRGRIWRIVPAAAKPAQPRPLPGQARSTPDLANLLEDPNGWCRDTAQRLLIERKDPAAVAPLRRLVERSTRPQARAQALWTLDGLSALDMPTLRLALRDADPAVREQAARLATPRADAYVAELVSMIDDPEPSVRLRAAVALGHVDQPSSHEAIARFATRDAASPWTSAVALASVGGDPSRLLRNLLTTARSWSENPSPAQADLLERLASNIAARNDEPSLADLLRQAANAPAPAAGFALLLGLTRGQSLTKSPRVSWRQPPTDTLQEAFAPALKRRDQALDHARSPEVPVWTRVLALRLVSESHAELPDSALVALLSPQQPPEIQLAAVRAVDVSQGPKLVDAIVAEWASYTLATRRALLATFVGSVPSAERLLAAVERGVIAAGEFDPASSAALRRLGDAAFRTRAEAVLQSAPSADRAEVVRRYQTVADRRGDGAKGRALFVQHCQACHARNGQGAKVGPDLISVAGRPESDLIVAILDPSREVAPDSRAVVVVTHQGQTLTGLLVEESPTLVRLRRAEGIEDVVPRADIDELRPTNRSLMPDGLEQVLTPESLADLIAYLRGPIGEDPNAR